MSAQSNREALRRLSRKFPAPPEIEKIMDDLSKEQDRSVAIVASAIAEASLERLIATKFKHKNKNLLGQIFLNRGPLSDFHSKILIAQAFGIITSPMAEELHSIKTIRNTFAHAEIPLDFDNKIIAGEIRSFKMLSAAEAVDHPSGPMKGMGNKSWFTLTVRILLILFDGMEKHPGIADDALADALKQ